MEDFQKLWATISGLNHQSGVGEDVGDLKRFLQRFQTELDQFVAEFECLPEQVGAIVLIAGHVLGIERAPSRAYFSSIWRPLIRECYGSRAVQTAQSRERRPPVSRIPLRKKVESLDDISDALKEAEQKEEEVVRAKLRALVDTPFSQTVEDQVGNLVLETLNNRQFVGQVVREGDRVCYGSLVMRPLWLRQAEWKEAQAFEV